VIVLTLEGFVVEDVLAHDRFLLEQPQVQGDKVVWTKSVTAGFYATLGVAPVRFVFEAMVRSGKIKSIVAYLPMSEIARIETACRTQVQAPLIYARPCR
jgi:hypothetical protein